MNPYLPLVAGALALLAVGIAGGAAGSGAGGLAAVGTPCTLHVALIAPSHAGVGQPFAVFARATESGSCPLAVQGYSFQGLPQQSGPMWSVSGQVTAVASHPGVYVIAVVAMTNLGTLGTTTVVTVR